MKHPFVQNASCSSRKRQLTDLLPGWAQQKPSAKAENQKGFVFCMGTGQESLLGSR